MKLPRLSTFPLHKPFEQYKPTAEISEIVLRLVVDIFSADAHVVGTATPLCVNLLATARHVFDAIIPERSTNDIAGNVIQKSLSAVQVLPGLEYVIWNVAKTYIDPFSDIALLSIATNPMRSNSDNNFQWRQPKVNPFAPDVGERVAAFGYRNCSVSVSKNDQDGRHVDIKGDLMGSIGVVRDIFEMRRDQHLPFPCYQVSARFDGGMSGGPVFDETGSLCGLVCSNIDSSHLEGEPISYVTTLWPLFCNVVNGDRGDKYPQGVSYPAIELARGGQIFVADLPRLEEWLAAKVGPYVPKAYLLP